MTGMLRPLALSFALLISFQGLAMTQQADRIEIEVKETQSLDYLIALPEGYDTKDKEGDAVPLVLFLHGAGDVLRAGSRALPRLSERGPRNLGGQHESITPAPRLQPVADVLLGAAPRARLHRR